MRTGASFFVGLLVLYMPAGLVLVCQPFFKKGGEVGVSASYRQIYITSPLSHSPQLGGLCSSCRLVSLFVVTTEMGITFRVF